MNKTKLWIAISACFLVIVAMMTGIISNQAPDTQNITLTNVGFDTPVQFKAECSAEEFEKYTKIVRESFTYYNSLFDKYHAYDGINNIYTLNQEAYDHAVEVDDELLECIELSLNFNNPAFDITEGNVLNLWHTYREEGLTLNEDGKSGTLPEKEAIEQALSHAGKDKVVIEGNTIRFTDPELSLDLGGVAKGYACQKTAEKLKEAGLECGLINAGGNVVLIGEKKDSWHIGIQNPEAYEAIVTYATTSECAIVTSGDYQRYYMVDDTMYSHIIDFSTGYPANNMRSVTVITNDSALADMLSTALFCMNVKDGQKWLEDKYPDVEAIWILDKNLEDASIEKDGYYIYTTDNVKEHIKS